MASVGLSNPKESVIESESAHTTAAQTEEYLSRGKESAQACSYPVLPFQALFARQPSRSHATAAWLPANFCLVCHSALTGNISLYLSLCFALESEKSCRCLKPNTRNCVCLMKEFEFEYKFKFCNLHLFFSNILCHCQICGYFCKTKLNVPELNIKFGLRLFIVQLH